MKKRGIGTRRSLIGLVAGLSLIAAACGSDDSSSDQAASSDDPVSSETAEPSGADSTSAGDESADESAGDQPSGPVAQRIVSLSPTHTEMLFAIGAGDQVIAVDSFSNYPAEVLELPNELSAFEPNVEAIASFEPDLVVIGGDFTGLGAQLDELGIAWWDGPAAVTLDDTYSQIEQLGVQTGRVGEAAELVLSMQTEIDTIVAATPAALEPLSFYHELDPTLYSADSTTFIGEIYALVGLRNIADQTEGNSGGFPQLNAEFVVSADPDLIFLADTKCCGESGETVASRDGWAAMVAVQNDNVIEMDDDIASRWGPRVVEYLAAVAAAIENVKVPA
ncbi:MAG: ABC transporter substrate-binding protein [Actinobacteria bacterium]|nr:ABC transporter substrate-binding protein [Actinomycetota bacterium]